ncbi:hypothetical protein ACHAC9_15505 [Massilia sp. CMS3.1]|uniref:hypothetical protein n=1 Tax=Massilia sp. CMS3.1 TaxID=3373083 RepID=UPI003EE4DA10
MKHIMTACLALALLPTLACAQARLLRDPFARPALPAPAVAAEPEVPQVLPELRAVMVGPSRALANINGQILAVGEWFGDYQLIKVEERGVTLTKRGVKSVLVLNEASRK